jgi:hypothetical protein
MGNKITWLILGVVIIAGLIFLITGENNKYTEVATFSVDTTIEDSYIVNDGESVVLEDGATLNIEGDLTVNGSLECRGGDLNVVVSGSLNVIDRIYCQDEEGESSSNINIVLKGEFNTENDSEIITNGSIQVVENEDLLLDQAGIDALYDETERDIGEGQRIGPFVEDDSEPENGESVSNSIDQNLSLGGLSSLTGILLGNIANAQGAPGLRGRLVVNTPPKGVKQIVLFNFPSGTINIIDYTLDGPDGRKGSDDKGGSCNAKGGDGENAFRFNAFAPNIKVGTFTLNLGDGGAGGDAETTKNCDPGVAKGGKGGKSGNFRMIAGNKFEITGSFIINPGKGGKGGDGTAHGKDGGPSEDGGDANGTGGVGAKNKKRLSVVGSVAGVDKVQIGDIVGGDGGEANADPGTGGDADTCGLDGGDGGSGVSVGGNGGDASVQTGGSATRTAGATDTGGKGGDSNSHGAKAGNGGSCDHTAKGGDGGDGGDASTEEGRGGKAKQNGKDGTKVDETGGDGGNGGDGCVEGKGGDGGSGEPDGKPGKDGKNLCQNPKQPQTSAGQSGRVSPQGGNDQDTGTSEETSQGTTGNGTAGDVGGEEDESRGKASQKIKVIQFMDYYIPIDQLIIVPGHEPFCSDDHWHPAGDFVTNTMGFPMSDPNSDGCGFGLVNQTPVVEVEL